MCEATAMYVDRNTSLHNLSIVADFQDGKIQAQK